MQALFDQGHEPRDLRAVVLSRRAVNNFDLHSVSPVRFEQSASGPVRF
jgi:hypothetical protein